MTALPLHTDEAEVAAQRAWAWLKQIQRDRSLPRSCLTTAALISRGPREAADIDLAALRAYLAERDCSLDRDVQALTRGRHLLWCLDVDGTARATLLTRRDGRRGGRK